MPKPPNLPVLDWERLFRSGLDWTHWLETAGKPENRQDLESKLSELALDPHAKAFVAALAGKVHVVAIAEDWCGDVRRHVPVLQALADAAGGRLEVRYVSRDVGKEVFLRHLTNGGEAIPKFVFLSERFVETGNWGPMPLAEKRIVARGKAAGDIPSARALVAARYAADPRKLDVLRELLDLIDVASTVVV
jgi:thiol-disulfide isomerase/thioredoxin